MLRRQKQSDLSEFKVSLVYIVRPGLDEKSKAKTVGSISFVYCIVNSLQLVGYLVEESQSKDLWNEWEFNLHHKSMLIHYRMMARPVILIGSGLLLHCSFSLCSLGHGLFDLPASSCFKRLNNSCPVYLSTHNQNGKIDYTNKSPLSCYSRLETKFVSQNLIQNNFRRFQIQTVKKENKCTYHF